MSRLQPGPSRDLKTAWLACGQLSQLGALKNLIDFGPKELFLLPEREGAISRDDPKSKSRHGLE